MEYKNEIKIYDNLRVERVYLGGTGVMYRCIDSTNNKFLFKPAESKWGESEEFRAYVQEAAYYVQSIVDSTPNNKSSVIKCEACIVKINGKEIFGAMQEEIPVQYNGMALKAGKLKEIIKNDPRIMEQLMREFVVDYLLCNFDSHAGNFIIDKEGILRGVDKEQSFRYINDVDDSINIHYHPNSRYGEQEPIYNTIFKMYINGGIDIDFDVIEKYIKRVEEINDWQYMEQFRQYAESLCGGKNNKSEELLTRIRERKTHLREACFNLVSKLKTERAKVANARVCGASKKFEENSSKLKF